MKAAGYQGRGGRDVRFGAVALELDEKLVHGADDAALMLRLQAHSCGVRRLCLARHMLRMPTAGDQKAALALEIRQWMLSVMDKTGLSPRKWAIDAGLAPSTVHRAIKEDYPFVTSSRSLAMLARVANVDPPNSPVRAASNIVTMRIRYLVQAGAWYEVGTNQGDYGEAKVVVEPETSRTEHWVEELVGDSLNKLIPDGAWLVVETAFGYQPTEDDIVVVERRRDEGRLRERSVKQVHIRPDGEVELWPRSYNPTHQQPLLLHQNAGGEVRRSGVAAPHQEGVEVEIVGLVTSFTKSFRRR